MCELCAPKAPPCRYEIDSLTLFKLFHKTPLRIVCIWDPLPSGMISSIYLSVYV